MTGRPPHQISLLRIAALVAAGDLVTKLAAARFLSAEPTVVTRWLRFGVVHNSAGPFGISLGSYTWEWNVVLTLAAILIILPVARELSAVDRLAPQALGLIVGGAFGNLVSLVLSPRGVIDFIGVHVTSGSGVVLNVADLAAYTGLAMIARTGVLLVLELRRTVQPAAERARQPRLASSASLGLLDREVARTVFRDDGAGRNREVPVPMGVPVETNERGGRATEARVLAFPTLVADRAAPARSARLEEEAGGSEAR